MTRNQRLLTAVLIAGTGLTMATARAGGHTPENQFIAQFEAWYTSNPPRTTEPLPADRALLEKHKPRYNLAADARNPVDFYRDYIANGSLHDATGKVIAHKPDRATLNAHALDPGALFVHDGPAVVQRPGAVYGRVDRDKIASPDGERALVFLTYTLAFETSGLPFGLTGLQEFAVRLVADPSDWHQLDHYINVTIALDETKPELQPIAAIFQQHNYTRSWRLGGAEGPGKLGWPADSRLAVDIAKRSNEAYPHRDGPTRWRCASFMDGASARWLLIGGAAPMTAAEDVTDPARSLDDLPLITLPPSDAFYTFRGSLGARRSLPGRSGPPGADFNTLAALKRPVTQLAISYWYEGLEGYSGEIDSIAAKAWSGEAIDPQPFLDRFWRDWAGPSTSVPD